MRARTPREAAHGHRRRRWGIATAVVVAVGTGGFALAGAASAADPKPDNPEGATVGITSTTVAPGGSLSFSGTGWLAKDNQAGAEVGIKIDDTLDVGSVLAADGTGAITGSVTIPDTLTGGGHWLRFLSGGLRPGVDTVRSLHTEMFSVGTPPTDPEPDTASVTLANTAVQAGQPIVATGAHFPASAKVTVKLQRVGGPGEAVIGSFTTDADGGFAGQQVTIPDDVTDGTFLVCFFTADGTSVQVNLAISSKPSDGGGDPTGDDYEVVKTLDAGLGSYEVAVDPGLGKVFTAAPGDKKIFVIDAATRAVVDSFTLPRAPYGLTVNTTTHTLYTTDSTSDKISVIDAVTGDLEKTIDIDGIHAHGLEADSVHNKVYITEADTSKVAVLDGATNALTGEVPTDATPVQIAIDTGNDSYWVSATAGNTLVEYSLADNTKLRTVPVATGPQNLVYNPVTKDLVVDNFGNATVQVVDTETGKVTHTIAVGDQPIGVSVDTATNHYFVSHLLASGGKSDVTVIDGATYSVSQVLKSTGTGLGIGTDSVTRTTYVTDRDSGAITVIAPTAGDDNGGGNTGGGDDNGGGASSAVTIYTQVPESGGLAMSVASGEVGLSAPEITPDLQSYVSTGTLPTVTVADLRPGNPGWSVTGSVSNFTGAGDSVVDGKYLGWTPKVVSTTSGQQVNGGAPVAPGVGFKGGSALGVAPAGKGAGTAKLGADLELQLPTNTAPGTYQATLTLTAI